ncbi:MAG: glycosyltransferase family 2 protein [Planctomycetes bacterium]|nr:glycosyltransferase family 2 protein [Planctomycetota bacterium]
MIETWTYLFWLSAALCAYVFVGYSAILAVSGLAPSRKSHGTYAGRVTLIIPAYNEERVLEAKLLNALALDYPSEQLEVLVASDGSQDGTVEIARRFEDRGVALLAFPERRGKASALNDAVGAARGEVICLCDANVLFRPDALRVLVNRLADPSVGAVSGEVRLASHESNFGSGEGLYYRLERRVQAAESRIGSLMGVDGGMYIIRKELFQPLPPDTILDDFVISMRVIKQGKRVAYEPLAQAMENGTPAARQEFRRRIRVSAGAVQSLKRGEFPPLWRPVELWQFLSHKLLRWLSPVWLGLLVGSNVGLWSAGTFYRLTLAGQVIAYSLAAIGLWSVRFRMTPLGGIPFYFFMSQVAMAVGLVKGICNRQPVTWAKAERGPLATSAVGAPESSFAQVER